MLDYFCGLWLARRMLPSSGVIATLLICLYGLLQPRSHVESTAIRKSQATVCEAYRQGSGDQEASITLLSIALGEPRAFIERKVTCVLMTFYLDTTRVLFTAWYPQVLWTRLLILDRGHARGIKASFYLRNEFVCMCSAASVVDSSSIVERHSWCIELAISWTRVEPWSRSPYLSDLGGTLGLNFTLSAFRSPRGYASNAACKLLRAFALPALVIIMEPLCLCLTPVGLTQTWHYSHVLKQHLVSPGARQPKPFIHLAASITFIPLLTSTQEPGFPADDRANGDGVLSTAETVRM